MGKMAQCRFQCCRARVSWEPQYQEAVFISCITSRSLFQACMHDALMNFMMCPQMAKFSLYNKVLEMSEAWTELCPQKTLVSFVRLPRERHPVQMMTC